MGDGGGVVLVSARHECMGGKRVSCIVSSVVHMLGMSVVLGKRGVRGVCEMWMCVTRGGVGGEVVSE